MDAKTAGDRWSRNVIAEVKGSKYPDEIVVIGGHIDSWDVGQGAHDDGGACIAAWEVLRMVKLLDLKPKRTIRCVLWTNEENGLKGAIAYRDMHLDELENHIVAIESNPLLNSRPATCSRNIFRLPYCNTTSPKIRST